MRSIARQLRADFARAKQRMSAAEKREAMQAYYADGIIPETEPAKSLIQAIVAFDRMAEESIGGEHYDEAAKAYAEAVKRYEQAEAGTL